MSGTHIHTRPAFAATAVLPFSLIFEGQIAVHLRRRSVYGAFGVRKQKQRRTVSRRRCLKSWCHVSLSGTSGRVGVPWIAADKPFIFVVEGE